MKRIKYTFKEEVVACFPGREFVLTKDPQIDCRYGFMWPTPFIVIFSKEKGQTFIASSPWIYAVHLHKKEKELELIFDFEKEERVEIHSHQANFKEGIQIYQSYFKKNYGPLPNMSETIQNSFRVRRIFFHPEFCQENISDDSLEGILEQDEKEIGGVDIGLFFDYAYNPETKIRCGNESPYTFQAESIINGCKSKLKKTYAYFDPYLVQYKSPMDIYRNSLQMKDKKNQKIRVWGNKQWHPYLLDEKWMDYSKKCMDYAKEMYQVDGIYLDEIGNGNQYPLNKQAQIEMEKEYVEDIHKVHNDLMCEFAPIDQMVSNFSIVLSDTRSVVNIYRFIFPELRFIRIICCDYPMGHSEYELNKSFFNGEGLWIDGDTKNQTWYPDSMKERIKKQYQILKEYAACFSSTDCEPLYKIYKEFVLCHRFSSKDQTIFTLLNTKDQSIQIDFEQRMEMIYPEKKMLSTISIEAKEVIVLKNTE